jgi:integrase
MPAKPRNVKSKPETTTADAHERAKDFLTQVEMHKLLTAARKARHGARDHLLMLMMYRHGLRVSEAVALRRKHVNTGDGRLWVSRLKGSLSTEHRIDGRNFAPSSATLPAATISCPGCSYLSVVRHSRGMRSIT